MVAPSDSTAAGLGGADDAVDQLAVRDDDLLHAVQDRDFARLHVTDGEDDGAADVELDVVDRVRGVVTGGGAAGLRGARAAAKPPALRALIGTATAAAPADARNRSRRDIPDMWLPFPPRGPADGPSVL